MTTATARIDPRMRARRVSVIRQQGRRRLRVLVVVVGAMAIGGAAWLAVTSPLLDVDRVVIRGTEQVRVADVRAAADVQTGDALLLLDVGELERSIEAVPAVSEAHVRRDLPDELRITVVERVPVGWAPRDGDHVAVVDSTGRVIADAPAPPAGLPEIVGLTRLPELGARVAPAAATRLLEQLPAELRIRVGSVVVMAGVAALRLVDGAEVRLGPAVDVDTKGRTVLAVLKALGETRVSYIDVRVPGSPVTG
ncbi:MAG: cell division protein FtsQ/DivIB [Actinomycetota bacterium]